jgi:hypothetical protein
MTRDGLVKGKLLRDMSVVSIADAFPKDAIPAKADVEDLIDADVYEMLVKESHAKRLKGKNLQINNSIPRLAKRMELAFKEIGLDFHKPARHG